MAHVYIFFLVSVKHGCTFAAHYVCLCSVRHHTVCEPGKGLEIETHKDTETETQAIPDAKTPQECPLYCVQG